MTPLEQATNEELCTELFKRFDGCLFVFYKLHGPTQVLNYFHQGPYPLVIGLADFAHTHLLHRPPVQQARAHDDNPGTTANG